MRRKTRRSLCLPRKPRWDWEEWGIQPEQVLGMQTEVVTWHPHDKQEGRGCTWILWGFVKGFCPGVSNQVLLTQEFLSILSPQQWEAAQESPSELQGGERTPAGLDMLVIESQRFNALNSYTAAAAVSCPCCRRGWKLFLHC